MREKVRVAVVGASGYAGGELIRLLARADGYALTYLASDTYAGQPVCSALPGLRGELPVFTRFDPSEAMARCDALFLAQANGEAMRHTRLFLDAGKKVVDVSADFRLRDASLYPRWYGLEHADPESLREAVYGLPELHRERIRESRLVANPGCYPTAALLALAPLLEANLIERRSIVIDAKSGVSGAGRSRITQEYLFTELNESVKAYGVGGKHRHTPEIEQELSRIAGASVEVCFTPHLIPMTRGLLATCYACLKEDIAKTDVRELHALFESRYAAERFVCVYPESEQPTTKACLGSNQCHLGIAFDERASRVIVTSALDNLGKGAAGQAIQNMNLMFGLPEEHGLEGGGLWP